VNKITKTQTAELLKSWDNILVISHASPDGDTLGSATALIRGLEKIGKTCAFVCSDPVPEKFAYLFEKLSISKDFTMPKFAPDKIVTVDVADAKLMGKFREIYGDKVDLAIDHHATNTGFADKTWVKAESSAACEMIYELLVEMEIEIDKITADCLFTGISTDTGCFKHRNTTAKTHEIAAALMEMGADSFKINTSMFDTKTREQVLTEQKVMNSLEFFCDGRVAVVEIPQSLIKETGVLESDLEAIPSMTRQIEGVLIGITLKEKNESEVKASLRTGDLADSSEICGKFGGGGHQGAAGCAFYNMSLSETKHALIEECERYLKEIDKQ